MKLRMLAIGLALMPAVACAGGHRSQVRIATSSFVEIPSGFVVVPFAVPVAMPSYVQYQALDYGYTAAASAFVQPPATSQSSPASAAASAAPSKTESPAPDVLSGNTLISSQCGKCHGAVQPKAGLDLTGALDDATRLKAITRLLADDPKKRMPPGKDLAPDLLGSLIQELATAPQKSPSQTLTTE
jgi:cytochrome c5